MKSLTTSKSAAVGGDATIAGSAYIGHNLKVDGWLDAPNIKSPCKGMYPTLAVLTKAYPAPRPGWWALVGSELPADIYIADNGWKFAGGQGGQLSVEISQDSLDSINQSISELTSSQADLAASAQALNASQSQLSEAIDNVESNVEAISSSVAQLATDQTSLSGRVSQEAEARQQADDALSSRVSQEAEARQQADDALSSLIADIANSDVCSEFAAVVPSAIVGQQSSPHSGDDANCEVVFVASHGAFALCVQSSHGALSAPTYYSNWVDRQRWGQSGEHGALPERGKLYYCKSTKKLYVWDAREEALNVLELQYDSPAQPGASTSSDTVSSETEWMKVDELKRIYGLSVTRGFAYLLPKGAAGGNARHPVITNIIDVDNSRHAIQYGRNNDIRADVAKVMWLAPGKTDLSYLCFGLSGVKDLLAVEDYFTQETTNMAYAFAGCSSLQSLDLSEWDASMATSMNHMFSGCSALKTIKFGHRFLTDHATNMTAMFEGCSSLEELDLSEWDTSSLTRCSGMFANANSLRFIRTGAQFFATTETLPLNIPSLGFADDNTDNGWLAHIAETAPTITDGEARTIALSDSLKGAPWAADSLDVLRSKGYTIG